MDNTWLSNTARRLSPRVYMSQVMYFVILHIRDEEPVERIYDDMGPWVEARQKARTAMELLLPGDSLRILGNGCFIEEWKK